jgi:N6-adenosine-specific RNA methylase IME4
MSVVVGSWSCRIVAAWNKSREAIFEVGRLLIEAKDALPHGSFEAMVESELPFGSRTAQMLMRISTDERLTKANHGSALPASWRTLAQLTTLDDVTLERGFSEGIIKPDMQRKDVVALKRVENRVGTQPSKETGKVADLHALAGSGRKYGTIYADPPWLYDNQGTRAATGNHYDGMTVDELCALPVRELAAEDAHLHLWTTNAFLFDCPQIFEAWGFTFKSSFVWVKPQIGIGNYWRNAHEFLLTAVRGDATRFNDKSLRSWLECDRGAHSTKPEQVRSFIERASPGPYLELFGRRVADGWDVWGNEIERSIFEHSVKEVA